MKIIQISFTNINNLKGETVISFENEPLSTAGIFAITGPTGSGKSTILDVITLALFNKIPRFKKSISKSEIEGMGSVVTHHTDNAVAQITYEIKGRKFTSEWTVSRARTGKLRDYEMFIYDSEGKPLDLKKSEVPSKNEEIIGLNYDQFVKSIILSQGQFAKFLKADKNERGLLLENLTGSSIYRKIGMAAYERFKEVRNEVTIQKDRLDNIICLSDEERVEISTEIEENQKSKIDLDQKVKTKSTAKQIKQDLQNWKQDLYQKNIAKEDLNKQEVSFKAESQRLDVYEKLSPLLADLTRYNDARKVVLNLSSDIEKNEQVLVSADKALNKAVVEMSTLTQTDVTQENFMQIMSAFEKEINTLQQQILHVRSKGKETRERINGKLLKSKLNLDLKIAPDTAKSKLKEQLKNASRFLDKVGISLGEDEEKLKLEVDAKQEKVIKLKELHHIYEHQKSNLEKQTKLQERLQEISESNTAQFPLLETKERLEKATKEKIDLLTKQKLDAQLIANLSEQRSQLIDGEPCPLCGAEHHPYTDHLPQESSKIDLEIEKAKKDHDEVIKEVQAIRSKLTANQTALNLTNEQLQVVNKDGEENTKNLKLIQAQIKGVQYDNVDEVSKDIEVMEQKLAEELKALELLHEMDHMQELVDDFTALENILVEHSSLSQNLKKKYTGEDVSKDCNLLQNQFSQSNTKISTLSALIANATETKKELELTVKNLSASLLPHLEEIGFSSIENTASYMMSEQELNILKSKKDEMTKARTSLETQIKTLQDGIQSASEKDELPHVSFEELLASLETLETNRDQSIKTIGEKTAILQKDDAERARIKSKETEIKLLNEKLAKWDLLNKMIGDSNGSKFANFAQGLTLQNLLVFANRRLENLTDRYLLDKPVKDGPLTVVDLYQGNIRRSVTTLSGGESFLISLALALSLSDMASKNVRLESLFIDEGFGTLDQDTLDMAMSTLEKLQSESQKTVGVISHVETLKERINVQIKLEKDAMGYSKVVVEG